ncbi:MAG: HlyD family efflux transporter periplasmic adaptor subunit [Hyphomicrobiales bacterium]|nr:MAG: HlyD family efflux transporter periplasmic adaptor subunit [Hyphomicrobiales bacterium]
MSRTSLPLRAAGRAAWGCALLAAWAATVWASAVPAAAHGGHDHGTPEPALMISARPRLAVETDLYQLVAIAMGAGRLTLFLDRTATNAPVTDARIALVRNDASVVAAARPDGSYDLVVPELATPGAHPLIFQISHADGDDLIAGEIDVPAAAPAEVAQATPRSSFVTQALPIAAALVGGLAIGFIAGRRRPQVQAALFVLGLLGLGLLVLGTPVEAHEGHAPSPVPDGASLTGDLPRRLADGSVFMPKPSQRLLSVLSERIAEGNGLRAVSLFGRIVADPNRSGVVQSINGGRLSAPDAGFPRLGQRVKQGEILALVTPALPLADQSTLAEKQRDLEGAIALAQQKVARLNRLGPGVTPRSNIEDAELEIVNLQQRLAGLKQAKLAPEVLTAPIDGIVSTSRAAAGQVVAAQDTLFQIVDTSSLWVEALVFDQLDPGAIATASAIGPAGTSMTLAFRGRSRLLQAQSVLLQFAVETPASDAAVGQPVTVIVRKAEPVKGLLVPREALVRGAAGETVVWEQIEPERFVSRQVRSEPFDAQRALVTGGVSAGSRVVVHGAELMSQVR